MPLNTSDPIRLLLIEDNAADIALVKEVLKQYHLQIEISVLNDGKQAKLFFDRVVEEKEMPPELVLLDLNLPKANGHEILAHIAEYKQLETMPVIVFTSSDLPEDIQQASELGAITYFQKKLDLDGFMELALVLQEFGQVIRARRSVTREEGHNTA